MKQKRFNPVEAAEWEVSEPAELTDETYERVAGLILDMVEAQQ